MKKEGGNEKKRTEADFEIDSRDSESVFSLNLIWLNRVNTSCLLFSSNAGASPCHSKLPSAQRETHYIKWASEMHCY